MASKPTKRFFNFRISSKDTTLRETLRLDSAKPTDPIDANEIVQQLLPGTNSLQSRLRILEELNAIILNYPFQHTSELWIAISDLLEAGVPHNARKAAWNFMNACIRGQFEDLGMLRAIFYQVIHNHEIWEDFDDKLQALKELTNNGRDIYGFEKNIVRLLAHWIESSFEQAKVTQHMGQQRVGMQKSTTSLATLSSTPQTILLQKPIPHLDTTMGLLVNVVRFNFVFFDELEIASLLDLLHTISINAPEDTSHIIGFLDVIVRYGYVPAEGLSTFLKILCITTLLDRYKDPVWGIASNLMKSHSAHSAIRLLCLNIRLRDVSSLTPVQTKVIQGSIRLLQQALWGNNLIDTLSVSLSTVLWSLKSAVDFRSKEVDQEVVRSLTVLLGSPQSQDLGDLEYEIMLDILERLFELINERPTEDTPSIKPFTFRLGSSFAGSNQQQSSSNPLRDAYGHLLQYFIDLYKGKKISSIAPRLMALLGSLQDHLPEDAMLLLLDYYYSEHQFYPYTPNWLERLHSLVQISVIQEKRSKIRSKALMITLDVYKSSLDFFHDEVVTTVLMELFDNLSTETDPAIASQISELLISASFIASNELSSRLLDRITRCIKCTCHTQKISPSSVPQPSLAARFVSPLSSSLSSSSHLSSIPGPQIACQSLSATIGIIDLFQYALYDPNGASKVDDYFSLLVELASSQSVHKASRLVLLDFLLGLRVDLDHRIFCSEASTVESIAAATEQLLGDESRQDRGDRSTASNNTAYSRSTGASGSANQPPPNRQHVNTSQSLPSVNWKPLMQGRTMQASPYVISYLEIASTTAESSNDETLPAPLVGCAKVILNIPLYMKGILSILEYEKIPEVYSFVIQRLPLQLFNKHLFCNSSEQIIKLLSVLVDITLREKVLEPLLNLPLSAKRHNQILAYKVLVILLCYHSKFSTKELLDLVYSFVVGLSRQATCAKICIHALVICCYELPQSMTKHLPGTILKLSQIMSTATISVHILEFLSTVARLPMLYSNFVENDYKRVFGIALKYIQYTHNAANHNAYSTSNLSTPSTTTSSPVSPSVASQGSTAGARALPQYVLILAYQVIDVWFMLQRLPERRKYVPYIVRNLLMANETGKKIDEQTETCMDMLARYSYANCEPKPKPSLVQQILVGSSNKSGKVIMKTWIQGNAFITVRTAQNLGWAEITVRRASGTASFLLKIENEMLFNSTDELDFMTLPGYLRLQEELLAADAASKPVSESTVTGSDVTADSERTSDQSPDPERREEETLTNVSGLAHRLSEARSSWRSPRTTPLHTPLQTPLHTPHHTPKVSPLPSGDNTPSSSPPSRSFLNSAVAKLAFEGGHHRVQTAPTEHVAVFASSLHPLQESGAPAHSQDDGSGDMDSKIYSPLNPPIDAPHFSSTSSSTATGILSNLGRSKSTSDHPGPSNTPNVKHAELSRGPLGGALEQTKSLLSHSMGAAKRDDMRRSISSVSSRHNSIAIAPGRVHRYVFGHDDHRSMGVGDSNADTARLHSKAKIDTFVDPSFLFMQLTSHPDVMGREVPILLADDDSTNRAIGVLDRTPVVDFHKIGVLYVSKGQTKEGEILGNTHGSSEYTKFLTGLGSLIRLKGSKIYAGGLDLEMDFDGEYAYSHQDEITQTIFHVATMMPNYPHDVNFDFKKRHIGNDWVTIVFNDSGAEYDFGTISGQFNFMTLVVTPVSMASVTFTESVGKSGQKQSVDLSSDQSQPIAENTEESTSTPAKTTVLSTVAGAGAVSQPFKNVWFKVVMLRRPDMPEIGPLASPKIISASELARFTRQMALQANIYAQVYYQHLQNSVEYVSNWQERLRQIKRVKERLQLSALTGGGGSGPGSSSVTGSSSMPGIGASSSSTAIGQGTRGGGSNAGTPGPSNSGASGAGNQSGGGASSGIGLGLGLGLGLGSSSIPFGGNNTSNSQAQQLQQNQQPSVMSLEPVVDFTRYA